MISEVNINGNEVVLDLGCGDGVLTEQLSTLVPDGKVIGIDSSIDMISFHDCVVEKIILAIVSKGEDK